MIWKKSGAGSSFKGRRRLIAALAALAVLILAAGFFAPGFLLRLALDRFAAETGFTYERAETGPFFRSARAFGPALTDPLTGERLRADLVEASGLKPLNFFRPRPGDFLADELILRDLKGEWAGVTYAVDSLFIDGPLWPGPEEPLPLCALSAHGLRASAPFPAEWRFSLEEIVLAAAAPAARGREEAPPASAGGGEERPAFYQFLKQITSLEAGPLEADLHGRPAGRLKTLKFSAPAGQRGGSLSLNVTLEIATLAPLGPFWAALADLAEWAPLPLRLSAAAETAPGSAGSRRVNMILESPGLGRLELALRLEGLPDSLSASLAEPATRTAALAALLGARLAGAALSFKDDGFIAKYYAYLARTEFFRDASGRPIPGLIQERWLKPFLRGLGGDAALADTAGLAADAEIFLRAPESLAIEAAPKKPLPLRRLVITDKYGIMERLGLTIAVNGRPSRPVAGAPALRPPSAGDASP